MGFLSKKHVQALLTREYTCPRCGNLMEFEDGMEETLVCLTCGYNVDSDLYGFDNGETYEDLYPTKEELLGYDEDENGEIYEEVLNELED